MKGYVTLRSERPITSIFWSTLIAALVLDVTAASAASSLRSWSSNHRFSGAQANGTTRGALTKSYQSLKPGPGEIRGLGSRWPDIGVAPGAPGGPTYYPKAMRPIEPE